MLCKQTVKVDAARIVRTQYVTKYNDKICHTTTGHDKSGLLTFCSTMPRDIPTEERV